VAALPPPEENGNHESTAGTLRFPLRAAINEALHGMPKVGALMAPALAEAIAECIGLGVLPSYGLYLLYVSQAQALRSGRVSWFTATANLGVYRRLEDPVGFWVAFSSNLLIRFALCAVPLSLFTRIFLPNVMELLRDGHAGP
jgi:hypothetical protein